jgi:hypothetical protein
MKTRTRSDFPAEQRIQPVIGHYIFAKFDVRVVLANSRRVSQSNSGRVLGRDNPSPFRNIRVGRGLKFPQIDSHLPAKIKGSRSRDYGRTRWNSRRVFHRVRKSPAG